VKRQIHVVGSRGGGRVGDRRIEGRVDRFTDGEEMDDKTEGRTYRWGEGWMKRRMEGLADGGSKGEGRFDEKYGRATSCKHYSLRLKIPDAIRI
jgi:hypothetical protein